MSNTYGRQVVVPLTNKSGGSVAPGDVVVIDTSNNDAFTTTTSAGSTVTIGVAQETIASNASGRVLTAGYASLVNVNASVTRGNYGKTHTVAKQATDAGASRVAGTFCQFLTGGTTPDAMIYPVDLAGAALTNPMTSVGDIIQGTTAGAPARLAAPLAGKVLTGAGLTTSVAYAYPPGYEFDYAEFTSNVTVNATSEATATTLVTGAGVAYDGSTTIIISCFAPAFNTASTGASENLVFVLYDGSSSIGYFGQLGNEVAGKAQVGSAFLQRRLTPSNATHTYSFRAWVTPNTSGTVNAGAGGVAAYVPGFIRQTKV